MYYFSKLIHPEEKAVAELSTTYEVQCLNTEQGLHWTKETKLPTFLASRHYSEYRLLKILNQVSVGAPKIVKLVDIEPLQTPRSIMVAKAKRAVVRDKIEKEKKEKEEKMRFEEEIRIKKQNEAFSKLKKAADPDMPSDFELEELNVFVGSTPSEELKDWYKHLKKAQRKGSRFAGSKPIRPTSASSGIERPGTNLKTHQDQNLMSSTKIQLTDPEEALVKSGWTPSSVDDMINAEERGPLVNRPRSGNICEVDESQTKAGILHQSSLTHTDEILGDQITQSLSPDPRIIVNPSPLATVSRVATEEKGTPDQNVRPDKLALEKKLDLSNEFFFRGSEDANSLRKFLENTSGETLFDFWLELDRCNFAASKEELKKILTEIKEKFCALSSPNVLPTQFRSTNNLRHITSFDVTKIRDLQNKTVNPLVTYWVPKFLNEKKAKYKQTLSANQVYTHHRKATIFPKCLSHPEPKTPLAFPLRPKSCFPLDREPVDGITEIKLEIPEKKKRVKSAALKQEDRVMPYDVTDVTPPRAKSAHQMRTQVTSSGVVTDATSLADDLDIADDEVDNIEDLSDVESDSGFAPSTRPTTGKRSSRNLPEDENEDDAKDETISVESYGSSIRDFQKFIGSAKMETLLQTLKNEFNNSGGVFKSFLESTGNQIWINCLSFWNELQTYHSLFYKNSLDIEDILRKAKAIFALYIVLTAPLSIGCTKDIQRRITARLASPDEETFDEAEEYSIHNLCNPWLEMLEKEEFSYRKVEQYSVKKPLEIDMEYLKFLNSQGIVKVQLQVEDKEPEIDEEAEREEFYRKLEFEIPEEFRSWKFDDVLKNRIEFEFYRKFIAENYGTTDLSCWVDIEGFKRMAHEDEVLRDTKAKEIKSKYINKKYFFGPNSPATTKEQELVLALSGGWGKQLVPERPPNVMLTEVGRYAKDRLERKWLAMFLATPAFANRQHTQTRSGDSFEDLVMQKKRKQLQLSKIMESKWVSSSKEVIQFRRALLNPVTSEQFKKYVRIVTKENFLENDICFWQEVQKFKDVFNQHADDSLAVAKVQMIIACFLESIIYPAVQVDIPPEQVQDVLDRRKKPTAYMFRESQLTVFRVLYPHWSEFCKFRHKMMSTTKVESTLDRKSTRQKQRQKRAAQKIINSAGNLGDQEEDGFNPTTAASNMMDDIIMSQGDNVTSWKYSAYIEALQRQHQSLLDDVGSNLSDASSIIGPMYPSESSPK